MVYIGYCAKFSFFLGCETACIAEREVGLKKNIVYNIITNFFDKL